MDWSFFDYALMGTMITLVVGVIVIVFRRSRNLWVLMGTGTVLMALFLLIWVSGAVGIIGSEDNPANLMFASLPVLVGAGGWVSRFKSSGMALTCLSAAGAHVAIALVALISRSGSEAANWPFDILGASTMFIVIWLVAAGMFYKAGRAQSARSELST